MISRRHDPDQVKYDEELREWEDRAEERATDIGEMTRMRFDEDAARNVLRPRTGQVQVQPRSIHCECGARETGYPHDGHRYACPRHSRHPQSRSAA